MAIKLDTRYPGRAGAASLDYPQGSFKNRSAPGVIDGTPLEKDWANDQAAFFQSLLKAAGITPNDVVDKVGASQYFNALKAIGAIPVWSSLVNYTVPVLVFGSNNELYIALSDSGPTTAPQDPVSTSGYWRKYNQSGIPFRYRAGLEISNNATDAINDIDFSPGQCADSSNTLDIKLNSTLTKRLDAAWSAGNNQGGLFTGSKANSTWYHCFILINNTTGVVDSGFDTSITASNRPSGWSYRYINSIYVNSGGTILPFINTGLDTWLKTPIKDVSVSAVNPGVSTNYVTTTPLGIRVKGKFYGYSEGGNTGFYLHPTDTSDITVDIALGNYVGGVVISSGGAADYGAVPIEVITNASSQVRYTSLNNASAPTTNIAIVTYGWSLTE